MRNNTDCASNIHRPSTRTGNSHLSVWISRTLLVPAYQQKRRLTHVNGRLKCARAADRLPLFAFIIGRLISHPSPLTCTWRCSGKISRHPSFGRAPPSGCELLHSNTPSRSQFAAGPASDSAARHIAESRMRWRYHGACGVCSCDLLP